jgi:hypothetical protein
MKATGNKEPRAMGKGIELVSRQTHHVGVQLRRAMALIDNSLIRELETNAERVVFCQALTRILAGRRRALETSDSAA